MKLYLALTFALFFLHSTCARAQLLSAPNQNNIPTDICNVAFIKNEAGKLIDSLTVRTSLNEEAYGFRFAVDTLVLDLAIFGMAEELTLETFAGDHSFGQTTSWVDAPTADIYLSIRAGVGVVDSVGLSQVDALYRKEVASIVAQQDLNLVKRMLIQTAYSYRYLLFAGDFLTTFADLPNLTRKDIRVVSSLVYTDLGAMTRHPRFQELMRRHKVMRSLLPGKLARYDLNDRDGKAVELTTPEDQFYVLNFYDSGAPASRYEHARIAKSMATDSLFTGVPLLSISRESPAREWQRYVHEGAFAWPHYHEHPTARKKISKRMQLYPANTYLLINKNNLIVGAYDSVEKLAAALLWRKADKQIP